MSAPSFRSPGLLSALAAICLAAAMPAAAQEPALEGAGAPTLAAVATPAAEPALVAPEPPAEPAEGSGAVRRAAPKPRRGGVNPCMTPDPGWGVYDPWSRGPSMGQMIVPHKGGITKAGSFDLLIHFHGHEPIRKEFVKTARGIVLVGIDLGIGSGAYQAAFSSPTAFTTLLESVERAVAKAKGKKKARIRNLALSSWSAGYGAIEQILRQPAGKKVDALILLDSVHAGYADEANRTLKKEQLEPFVGFARKAAAGEKLMFLSHSSIVPPGYASTTETAGYLVSKVGGKPRKASREDVLGLDMFQRYDKKGFFVRGYTGDDKPDHCAHLGLIADVVKIRLEPRWKSPPGAR